MSRYEYRRRNTHFPEAGPQTTNVNWGIERILGLYGIASGGGNCRDCILALEKYVNVVARLSTIGGIQRAQGHIRAEDVTQYIVEDGLIEMAALEANIEFPEEARER